MLVNKTAKGFALTPPWSSTPLKKLTKAKKCSLRISEAENSNKGKKNYLVAGILNATASIVRSRLGSSSTDNPKFIFSPRS
jgi:hypothetical protein